jgi:5-methyltetrahydropteroyltriglutamate--homocysteine methyltransferase
MQTANLGFPRLGPHRELKRALEQFWARPAVADKTQLGADELVAVARRLRESAWRRQQALGVTHIPSNDDSLYDHVLDTAVMVGAIPRRFHHDDRSFDLGTYFAMARGDATDPARQIAPLEMTKWFDTNYHYLVPELTPDQQFSSLSKKPWKRFREAQALGIVTRPVLLGPVTFLLSAKSGDASADAPFDPLDLLPRLLPIYGELLADLTAAGAEWVQIDEPVLVLDLSPQTQAAFAAAYESLAAAAPQLKLMLTTYFGELGDNLATACRLPVAGLHVDLVRGRSQLAAVLDAWPAERVLSLGVVDGRNVWRTDLDAAAELVEQARSRRQCDGQAGDRLIVAPSCSLLHVPHDLELETKLDDELKGWLAFAVQKLEEVVLLAGDKPTSGPAGERFVASRRAIAARRVSSRIHRPETAARGRTIVDAMFARQSDYSVRRLKQQAHLKLPPLPTTTIGSFPQTDEVRKARAEHKAGRLTDEAYREFLRREIAEVVRLQEEIGLDVLVHGEAERNDMVEYFGERLEGFAFTEHGWVQSYGSRCVKPPIVFGDVERPEPMTVEWSKYAQSLTTRPMKGMLTGPVTILQWSFVRDDQPRSETCRQIALALRSEVCDLEAAGIRVIQIDEPALREGLPLRRRERAEYLRWAVDCFRLAAAGVNDETQIHTHMCYAEFNDIIEAVAALDADVISIETSRSRMELLGAFEAFHYPNEIGPGVHDIHSPRIPTVDEMVALLRRAARVLRPDQLWVNPDCGLKTRRRPEVKEALTNMVAAAKTLREQWRTSS